MGNSATKPGLISKIATSTSTDYNAARLMMAEEDYDDETVEPGLMIDCKDQLLKCGQMVDGQYKIEKLIGKGTYAQVYKAEKKSGNYGEKSNVAIKCCYSRNDQDWKLITSEILAMKSLNHTNVLEFYEYFEIKKDQTIDTPTTTEDCTQRNEPLVGIVMEYCNNGSIGDFLKRNKHVNADFLTMIDWFIQSVKGLSYCHKMNLCHRDIKPHNILIHLPPDSTSQVIKLCDFGLSSLLQDKKEKLNTFCGSPIYAAPEINRLCYTLSVDIYSLGISFLELFSKIENKEFHSRMYNKSRDVSVLTKVISNIPLKCLQKIITAMTLFEPKERITGEELLAHPIIRALESTILMSKGLYSADNLENANEEYIETICELLGFYHNDTSRFEVLFQQLTQLFEYKPRLFVDVVTKQINQIGDEFLFTQGVSLEAQSCILFILISVAITLCSQETPVPKRHSSLMDKKSSLYNVFVDSLTVISEHSPHIGEDVELLKTNIHLIANIKQFILEFANIAGETIQTTILSFLIQTLMMDTANRSPNNSSNNSPKNSSPTSLFTIDDKSFVFNLIREMVIRFEACKEIVILKNKQMPTPSTTTMTSDHYAANRISHSFGSSTTEYLVAHEETTTTTTTASIVDPDETANEILSSEASIELRVAFLRAIHQRLLSSQTW
ncbi:serine/threonine protein kinase [Naegleria gruberi]|uniref:Serine/threonine protein kinase n=1 Tax=Naegleria gruberi TaxID=5762 RepID=D2V956_NAEGR|nr:serine/threonine protein kinase [Naegleria gruberi]EFC46530.1 serine/threonine protein kinase [Naegleria gruberi]|eukprot:XP_002679274.1 serine/threonine protein kinase [Naegleria gruberi strain NEG-M]